MDCILKAVDILSLFSSFPALVDRPFLHRDQISLISFTVCSKSVTTVSPYSLPAAEVRSKNLALYNEAQFCYTIQCFLLLDRTI